MAMPAAAVIGVADPVTAESAQTVAQLHAMGLKVTMLTGVLLNPIEPHDCRRCHGNVLADRRAQRQPPALVRAHRTPARLVAALANIAGIVLIAPTVWWFRIADRS